MRWLAEFIMRGRLQATLVTSLCAVGVLILLPLHYLSGAAVGLVTLRRGAHAGMRIVSTSATVCGLLAFVVWSNIQVAVVVVVTFALALWGPVWGLGIILRRTVSMPLTLEMAGLIAGAFILIVYLTVGDPSAWWREVLARIPSSGQANMQPLFENLDQVAGVLTGVMGVVLAVGFIGSILLARWWQAMLYNPGGFREEFHHLHYPLQGTTIPLTIILMAALPLGGLSLLARDLLYIVVVVYTLAGLAFVHWIVSKTRSHVSWLVGLYLGLMVALPQLAVLLALTGLADSWLDLRQRMKV
jgi:hypothetical protein